MAGDFQGLVLEKAELLSSRLKEVLSAGQGYVRDQLGLDLALGLELYPTWMILSAAAAGLLLLGLTWAAVFGGVLRGKKRGSPVTQSSCEPDKAAPALVVKPEEQKKRSRRKAHEKVPQMTIRRNCVIVGQAKQVRLPHDVPVTNYNKKQ